MWSRMKLLSFLVLVVAASAGPIELDGFTPAGLVVPPDVGIITSSNGNTFTSSTSGSQTNTDTDATTQQGEQNPGTGDDTSSGDAPGGQNSSGDSDEASGSATNDTSVASSRKRTVDGFNLVFSGSGTGPDDRDATIVGDGYLTYVAVPNSIYDVDGCEQHCYDIPQCVFFNIYYEYNRDETTDVFCSFYSQYYTAADKTNFGGQYRLLWPAGPTYVQDSAGYAYDPLLRAPTLEGYDLVFGPLNGATSAPAYMGYATLDSYDIQACAALCNNRDPDPIGGVCQFFNIWQGVFDSNPTSYSCSMYYLPTDASTATNYGQGDLQVTYSRGFQRVSVLPDGGFESYQCSGGYLTCWTYIYAYWIGSSPSGGQYDATIFHDPQYAHTGAGLGLLGSAQGADDLAGTLEPINPLNTVAGKQYVISFFQMSWYSTSSSETEDFEVLWNGLPVLVVPPGYTGSGVWDYCRVVVTATGNDLLSFHGGGAPDWAFLDDISVFQM